MSIAVYRLAALTINTLHTKHNLLSLLMCDQQTKVSKVWQSMHTYTNMFSNKSQPLPLYMSLSNIKEQMKK